MAGELSESSCLLMVQHIRRTMSRGTGVSRGRGVNRGGGGRGGEEDQWRVWRRRGDEQTFTTRPSVGRGRGRGILQHPANHVMGFRQERGTLYQPLMTAPPPPSYPLLQHPQFHQPNLPQHVRYTTPPLQPRLSLPPPHPPPHPHRPPHRSAHHHRLSVNKGAAAVDTSPIGTGGGGETYSIVPGR